MARRHLTLTLTFTLDEDTCRDNDQTLDDDGHSVYEDTLNLFRTGIQRVAQTTLAPFDLHIDNPEVHYHGVTYERNGS